VSCIVHCCPDQSSLDIAALNWPDSSPSSRPCPCFLHMRRFYPIPNAAKGRKRWILSVPVRGQLWLDAGAVKAVKDRHKSLFCPGITKVGREPGACSKENS
jgi:hypothetical protein